ncbi:hypothetical protein ACGFX8_34475 [Streptomyces sp. NPDC048362]
MVALPLGKRSRQVSSVQSSKERASVPATKQTTWRTRLGGVLMR